MGTIIEAFDTIAGAEQTAARRAAIAEAEAHSARMTRHHVMSRSARLQEALDRLREGAREAIRLADCGAPTAEITDALLDALHAGADA